MTPAPQWFTWEGDVMRPLNPRAADRAYTIGERYHLEHREDRSAASHRYYFAALNEAHASLPDAIAERFPTPDALRKYALIRTGFRDERSIACSSKAEARRLRAFIAPLDEFALVVADESTVTVYTAKSQSAKAMGKKTFAESTEAVLNYVAGLIGVTQDALSRASEAA